ncbi:MAG TPA: MotA/TolQ/ExbB proton channel family protein [Bryobacteraceae bacterium]|nr:MotA/TolQ/ExbB proton channel family protein [Bryobacteraceae bacterium]
MQLLQKLLYLVSNALLAPVLAGLLLMLGWTLVLIGGFLKEWFDRRRLRPLLERAVELARTGDRNPAEIAAALASVPSGLPQRLVRFVGEAWRDEAVLGQAIARIEHDVAASVARHSFFTRVSPMLGLMGTLIPLGPALSGLANGDMQVLAGNLVVAFTATVVGLLISALTFGIGLARRTWYSRDVTELEFICQRLTAKERAYAS